MMLIVSMTVVVLRVLIAWPWQEAVDSPGEWSLLVAIMTALAVLVKSFTDYRTSGGGYIQNLTTALKTLSDQYTDLQGKYTALSAKYDNIVDGRYEVKINLKTGLNPGVIDVSITDVTSAVLKEAKPKV